MFTKVVQLSLGSVTGYVERLNIHGDAKVFYIYPEFGPEKVRCFFSPSMKDSVIESVGKRATVHGILRYRARQLHAEEMLRVSSIEIHPPEEQVPSVFDLRGIFSNGPN